MVMLSEFAAEISCVCKTGIRRDGGHGFSCGMKLSGGLCQTVLDEICHRRHLDECPENMERAAFADGSCRGDLFEGQFLSVMVMDVLHHGLEFCLLVVQLPGFPGV